MIGLTYEVKITNSFTDRPNDENFSELLRVEKLNTAFSLDE
jgi:hypothetical protein